MPASPPSAVPLPLGASRLMAPTSADELLMYRLNRLLAVGGSLVVRLCEGGYGITRREWGLLMWLAQHPGMPPSELAQRLGLDRARTSRAISSLQVKKLLTRTALPGDRRQAVLQLTPKGLEVYEALFPQVRDINQSLLEGVAADDLAALDRCLTQMQSRAQALVACRTDVPRTYRLRGGRRQG